MGFQVKEPILVIGLGGAGSRLANEAKSILNSDCMIISNDRCDCTAENLSVHISTGNVINPSVQLIRGSTFKASKEIKSKISGYNTVILMSNLAGRAGSAIAPVITGMCKDTAGVGLVSFAVMPFKYEKNKIFNSGIALKRVRSDSQCTIVLDNDSMLESNPDLSPKACYDIGNSAIMHVVRSLNTCEISKETSVLSTSKGSQKIEESLRDSIKMLYGTAPPNAVKRSMLYVAGGDNVPVGVINSVTNLTAGIVTKDTSTQIDTDSKESKVVMLSTVHGTTKFDSYDPLGVIADKDTLDWSIPESSIDNKLDFYQME